ncbi:MAG: hypothetical protein KAT00_01410 [Planctomycetes bacterium]|nr:hypothetical protein [Planctomycetota bacterium]
MSPVGVPIWEYLVDPPLYYAGDKFQGIIVAPPEISKHMPDDWLLLLDMVGMESYPTYASMIEEVARFGLSRRFPKGFNFAQIKGKRVMLGLLHWRGIHQLQGYPWTLPKLTFRYCKLDHYDDCIYWGWPLAWRHHEYDEEYGRIEMPWGSFNPMRVIDKCHLQPNDVESLMPDADYAPGLFGVFPLSHFESVGYIPDGTNVEDVDLPVIVVEE